MGEKKLREYQIMQGVISNLITRIYRLVDIEEEK